MQVTKSIQYYYAIMQYITHLCYLQIIYLTIDSMDHYRGVSVIEWNINLLYYMRMATIRHGYVIDTGIWCFVSRKIDESDSISCLTPCLLLLNNSVAYCIEVWSERSKLDGHSCILIGKSILDYRIFYFWLYSRIHCIVRFHSTIVVYRIDHLEVIVVLLTIWYSISTFWRTYTPCLFTISVRANNRC